MPLDLSAYQGRFASDLDFLLGFQDLLLRAVEGARDDQLNADYRLMRDTVLNSEQYAGLAPAFIRHHADLGSLWPALKSFSPQWEPRRVEVRRQFEPAIAAADTPYIVGDPPFPSSSWTGAIRPIDQIVATKTMLPVAQSAIEQLIAALNSPRHNGGPPLDGVEDAIRDLRALHSALGEVLAAADTGGLDIAYNGGLAREVSQYAKRAARKLRDDPIPYAMSGLILTVLSACGFPGIGGFLSGVAANMKR
ncbi:hypothetical protein [Sphingomonas zeae]